MAFENAQAKVAYLYQVSLQVNRSKMNLFEDRFHGDIK